MGVKNKLKIVRTEFDETQEDIALVLGIAVQTYNAKEQNKRRFYVDEAIKLSRHFNRKFEELFYEDDSNTTDSK